MIRTAVSRLICLLVGHRRVRTITDVEWGDFSAAGGVSGTITGSRYNCIRCGEQEGTHR